MYAESKFYRSFKSFALVMSPSVWAQKPLKIILSSFSKTIRQQE